MTDTACGMVYVVDDDQDLGAAVARLLRRHGHVAEPFLDPAPLLEVYERAPAHCIVTDVMMGEIDGFDFADRVRLLDPAVAIIFMTAWPTTANAVDSVRRYGGLDYLEKPIDEDRLLAAITEGVAWSKAQRSALARTAGLTPRQRQVFDLLVKGHNNQAIAAALDISPKTVEDHRAAIVAKTGTNGIAQLIALAR
ncbi:FixJ family two-component response regulator [Sphingomonas faeni]|jgi:two-component system response regulator FixJ|uniref:FixJ family two-component response regulator n=1 Tax=Sphingomonas faeni TaxID=185950 RepID=A0A2T5TZP3_9SPHN|nr:MULTISPECIES: response regulator [Sphingomonas]PTW44729.1 FixJ family two-component response regulator [Sphingomonas faeni]RKE47341.1 LuxR family two component transcriptional regulator [Sphingomonas sp. PP-CC-1A-547]TCM07631.1 LuxR family two component transcriptional regulator [Sphingomonas sp. PP-CC-3G-468]